MSSNADLLRRAAVALREAAEAATGGSWDADGTELYAENGSTWIGETSGDEPEDEANARLAALMHPPVALALADLLDGAAEEIDTNPPDRDWSWLYAQPIKVARAVLREPEEPRDA